jgi:hypothetical protein
MEVVVMTDTWHTELTQDGDRWSFTLTQNGIWHSGGRNYRSRQAALKAADWHRSWPVLPSITDKLAALGLA